MDDISNYDLNNNDNLIAILRDMNILDFIYYYRSLDVLNRKKFLKADVFEIAINDKKCYKNLYFILNHLTTFPPEILLKFGYKILLNYDELYFTKCLKLDDLNSIYISLLNSGKFNINDLSKILGLMDYKVVQEFIKQDFIKNIRDYNILIKNIMFKDKFSINDYFNGDIEIVKLFNLDELCYFIKNYKGDVKKILSSKSYIDYVSHIIDPLFYRSILFELENVGIDTYIIEKLHIKNIGKYLDCCNNEMRDSLEFKISYFNDCNSFIKSYRSFNSFIGNLIIEYLFQDYSFNVLIDIKEIINFISNYGCIINKEHYEFYKFIYRIDNVDFNSQIRFYKKYKDVSIIEMFYDDLRIIKDFCNKDLVSRSIKLEDRPELYSDELSLKCGVPVYLLNGEKFNAIVRCHRMFRDDNIDENRVNNIGLDGYSFSMISDKNINIFNDPHLIVCFVYSNIDINSIAHISNSDSYSKVDRKVSNYETKKINKLYTSDMLMDNTYSSSFNEIVIMSNSIGIKPTALLCYDVITKNDVKMSREFNIPILLINKKSYSSVYNGAIRNNFEYVRSSDDLKKVLS